MKSLKYWKQILGLTITSVAIATPLVIAKINSNNQFNINNPSKMKTDERNQFYTIDNENDKKIQLLKNHTALLNEINSKYNNNFDFIWKIHDLNSLKIAVKVDANFPENKNKIKEFINGLDNYNHKLLPGMNEEIIYQKMLQNKWWKTFNFYENEKNLKISTISNSVSNVYKSWTLISQTIGPSGYPNTKFDWVNQNYNWFLEVNENIKINKNNIIINKNNTPYFFAKINKPLKETINPYNGYIKAKIDFVFKNENETSHNAFSLFNKDTNWDKFFILKPSNIEDDGNYYLSSNRPTIEFGFNLPLVNAITWYGKIPSKFIELKNIIQGIERSWSSNYQYLFNEIFSSKENFYNFFNTYLFNFANFFYDEITFNNLIKLIRDLANSNPSLNARKAVNELMTTKKDVVYNGLLIPANIRNVKDNTTISGSYYNINLLKSLLNINALSFFENQSIGQNSIWSISKFENIETINEWNAYSDVILPIILSQKIQVVYEDQYKNTSTVEVYNGKLFVSQAIKPAGVTGNFDSPYSTIKIKKIILGNLDTQAYLGTNYDVNSTSEFKSFVEQSKLNSTKTINGNIYASEKGFNDPIYMEALSDGIEIKFRYIANEKVVEESAWSDIQGDNEITPFMLIPDEAWGDDVDRFDTNPNSSLEEILSDLKSKELFERAIARPFIMKKNITTQDLKDAKKKYVWTIDRDLKIFNKGNIGDIFLTKTFKDKYNKTSGKPWWTWTFKELVQEEKNFQEKVTGAYEVVKKDYYQEEWFKNFVANKNLANKTMQDFFPKYDEGRFFVIGSYKPSIDSTQVQLTEEAGFYYAGQQKDVWEITNFNYVVELEVKNKTYYTELNTFSFSKLHQYNGKTISLFEYERMMNNLDDSAFKNKFKVQSKRFKEDQIKAPEFKYIPFNSTNPLIKNGYGKLVIDYQKSIPIVNQIGNEVVYEQLPFDMNKLVGLESFYKNYQNDIVSLEEYNKLSEIQKESKILIDNQNNQIVIGGRVFAKYQNFNIGFIDLREAFIEKKPENTIYGFNQDNKTFKTIDEFEKEWTSLSQSDLVNMFIKQEFRVFYDELVQTNHLKMYVKVEDNQLVVGYTFYKSSVQKPEDFANIILAKYDLICINSVITNIKENDDFQYGYVREKDHNMSFSQFKSNVVNKEFLVNYFKFNNENERQNFLNGINEIKITEQNDKSFVIKIILNENYVTYNEGESLEFRITPKEMFKHSIGKGDLSLNNFANNIKEELKNKIDNKDEIIRYLNSLSLDHKLSLFGQENKNNSQLFAWIVGEDENGVINPDGPESEKPEIKDIIFSFEGNDLKADVQFGRSNLVLDAKTKLVIKDFVYNLKVDLGIIDPNKNTKNIWLAVGISTGVGLILILTTWLIIRRQRNKRKYYGTSLNSQALTIDEKDIDNNLNKDNQDNGSKNID